MPRYTGWRRLSGDTADRPDLLDLGKKLLGHLSQQRTLSGVKTRSIQRTTADGSVVRARFDGDIPSIEVREATASQAQQPTLLEGFIVRPSPAAGQAGNADKNHVLLRPGWKGAFYDAAHTPAGYTGLYGPTFPDGIGHYGNLDWRNGDQSVSITFNGPESRYFGFYYEFAGTAFFKGQPLVVLGSDSPATQAALGAGQVRGAALRSVPGLGLCLFVAAHYPYIATAVDAVLRFQVEASPSVGRWREMPTLVLRRDAGGAPLATELLRRAVPAGTTVGGHPWHFNQSGTEARCIRQAAGSVLECVLAIAEDGTSASYSQTATAAPVRLTTSSSDATFLTEFGNFHSERPVLAWCRDGSGSTYVDPRPDEVTDTATVLYGPDTRRAYATSEVYQYTQDCGADPWYVAAVDFRDDVPVYAYARAGTQSDRTEASGTDAITRSLAHGATDTPVLTIGAGGEHTWSVTWLDETSETQAFTTNSTRALTEVVAGLRTDFLTVEALHTVSDVIDYALDVTYTSERQGLWTDTGLPGGAASCLPEHTGGLGSTAFDVYSTVANCRYNRTFEEATQTLVLGPIDLRYRAAIYGIRTRTISYDNLRTKAFSEATADAFNHFGQRSAGVYDYPTLDAGSYDQRTVDTMRVRVAIGSAVVYDQTDTWSDTSGAIAQAAVYTGSSTGPNYPSSSSFAPFPNEPLFTTTSGSETSASAAPDAPSDYLKPWLNGQNATSATQDDPDDPAYARVSSLVRYRDGYCYSFARPIDGATLQWAYGIGSASGVPAAVTLHQATGADPATAVRFHPVSFLCKTQPLKRI